MRHLIFPALAALLLLGCSKPDPPSDAKLLDSLVMMHSVEELVQAFGKENVIEDGVTELRGIPVLKLTLFPKTKQQVDYYLCDQSNKSFKSLAFISLENTERPNASRVSGWKTREGLYLGMKLSDVSKINAVRYYFNNPREITPTSVAEWNKGRLDKLNDLSVIIGFDPAFKFDFSKYETNWLFNSDDKEVVDKNPAVYYIGLTSYFTKEETAVAQAEVENDSTEAEIDSRTGKPKIFEKEVAFRDFHHRYIVTGQLPLLSLPFDQSSETEALVTNESPAGAFHAEEAFDGQRYLVGLLPDTSAYYGIVWRIYHPKYVLPEPESDFETHITTISKEGTVISTFKSQLRHNDDESPTSCGGSTSTMTSFILADLTFYSSQKISICQDESDDKVERVERLDGSIDERGIITQYETAE